MSILPEEILATVKSSMKTKGTRGPKKATKAAQDEADFRVREVDVHDDTPPLMSDFDDNVLAELSCDVYNLDKKVVIVSPIAGATLSEIKVKVQEDVITIKGARKNPVDASDDETHTAECFWGEFSRSIILPPNVDTSKIKASFKNGILVIDIPKTKSARERTIRITAS